MLSLFSLFYESSKSQLFQNLHDELCVLKAAWVRQYDEDNQLSTLFDRLKWSLLLVGLLFVAPLLERQNHHENMPMTLLFGLFLYSTLYYLHECFVPFNHRTLFHVFARLEKVGIPVKYHVFVVEYEKSSGVYHYMTDAKTQVFTVSDTMEGFYWQTMTDERLDKINAQGLLIADHPLLIESCLDGLIGQCAVHHRMAQDAEKTNPLKEALGKMAYVKL